MNTTEPQSPYQPLPEPISPVQNDPDEKIDVVTGDTSPVLSKDNVVTTTPPGSPPLSPISVVEQQNTDCVDTEEYEDSISDLNTINGDNIPSDDAPVDKLNPANNLMSIDDTTVVNVNNTSVECITNGDNESSYPIDDTNCNITKGQNIDQNKDTSGRNGLNTINGNNIPSDDIPVDKLNPSNNLTSIDNTTVINVNNASIECTTNGDNESSYPNERHQL